MPHFINVILPIPLQKLFTYSVSEVEAAYLKPGMRVSVSFGKSKIYTALVYKVHTNPPLAYEAKEIHQILDEAPIISTKQLQLWEWIASYYMCSLGEVMRAALPSAFLLESETHIRTNKDFVEIDEASLKDDEFLIYEALLHQSSLKIQDVASIVDKKNALPVIKRLLDKDVITVEETVYEKYKPKLVRYVKLQTRFSSETALKELLEGLTRAPKQSQVVLALFSLAAKTQKPVKVAELVKASNGSSAIIKTLIDKEILEEYYIQTDRFQFLGDASVTSKELNTHQVKALSEINTAFKTQNTVLFHGVTSSGKTEIYVKLIEEALQQKKQVLYLLPEIALTTQLVNRLQQYFGDQVAIYHSKYSVNERIEVWNHVLHNSPKARIVLGARSSILLPFSNLGLIVVDEEHEQSFKQFDPAPRYHARDAAVVLSGMHEAKTILGSATPSIESYFNATQGKYALVGLTRRYNDVLMPTIELIDLQDKYKRKLMTGHFSDRLIQEITETLALKRQVILFQNRRGYSPIVECTTCGHSPQCPNCDVSLTYHQYHQKLKCHYCGYAIVMLQNCRACGNATLDTKGFGTQQLEEEVKQLFPDVKVGRMDLDTTRGKYGYEKIITAFEQQELDVLVGTQMLTKGLDFRHVNLVGILNADSMLYYPDFRAHERSFQLMTQVAGRAGRTEERGKVLICLLYTSPSPRD